MVTKNKKEDRMREVFIPREGGRDGSLFVAVNGENLLLRRGVKLTVPERFAEVIDNSAASDESAASFIEASRR